MDDRLVKLLDWFDLRARVVHAGTAKHARDFPAQAGIGYLHLLLAGELRVQEKASRAQSIAKPTALLFMNPTHHRLVPQAPATFLVSARFEFGLRSGNPLTTALPTALTLSLGELPSLAPTFALLAEEAAASHCGRQAILDRLVAIALILMLRELMDRRLLDTGLLAGLADPQLAKAINAVHAEPARNWTLERLAQMAGMSRARFAVRFRETVGMTPGAYLNEWRLGLACTMLIGGKPLSVISDQIGYASASAFSRAFALRFGESPKAWGRAHR